MIRRLLVIARDAVDAAAADDPVSEAPRTSTTDRASATAESDADAGRQPEPEHALTPAQRALVSEVPTDQPSVPRPAIVHRLISMLGAREPQPVLLVGPAGSGRTTIAQSLAAELALDGYRGPLAGVRVHRTSVGPLIGQRNLPALAPLARDGVLVIDDVDVILRLGGAVDHSAVAALRAVLAGPDPHIVLVVATTSVDRLRSADPEIFTQVEVCGVTELDSTDVLTIAQQHASALADHHGVTIPPGVLAAAVLPRRHSDTREHPSLAVRRLDRSASAARMRRDLTAQTSDLGSDVPAQQYVRFDANAARTVLSDRIFGQDGAIRAVTDRLAVTRAALDLRPERPDGVFLFAGPTGTGKTALALELACEIYASHDAVIRLDMSEFAESHTVSKLYGSPPGYVGSTDPESWLTTRIRARPHCVLLLDEIEKAHPSVWNAFLQVFDAGTLTDTAGNRADFSEVVVVMTTNIGSDAFAERNPVGFLEAGCNAAAEESSVLAELRRSMRPELINRLDGTIVFRPLTDEAIRSIARHHLDGVVRRLRDRGWNLIVADGVEDHLVEVGFSHEYGARPLLRAIEPLVLRPLASVPAGDYQLHIRDGAAVITPAADEYLKPQATTTTEET